MQKNTKTGGCESRKNKEQAFYADVGTVLQQLWNAKRRDERFEEKGE
jgi:hypothetical protein